jgi:hypothetical protein
MRLRLIAFLLFFVAGVTTPAVAQTGGEHRVPTLGGARGR